MKLDLTNKLFEGGEAEIYALNSRQVAKIYKANIDLSEKERKVKALAKMRLPASVIKPVDLLYDVSFIGFSMLWIKGNPFSMLANRKFITANNINKKTILQWLYQLRMSMDELHKGSCYIGDLNDKNALINKGEVYLIDVDSYDVPGFPCRVRHPLFADPACDKATVDTDNYSYAVLAFKSLTRMHPFGGTYRDMDILERIRQRISVFNPSVVTPPSMDGWGFLPPAIVDNFAEIFQRGKRLAISLNPDAFILCSKHKDYYWRGFKRCPVCHEAVTIPVSVGVSDVKFVKIVADEWIKLIFDENCWLLSDDNVTVGQNTVQFIPGIKYHSFGAYLITEVDDTFRIWQLGRGQLGRRQLVFSKLHKSRLVIRQKALYYISKGQQLTELHPVSSDMGQEVLCDVAFRHCYNVHDRRHFFVCNIYDYTKILNVDSFFYEIKGDDQIVDWGIHFDRKTGQWLFAYTNQSNETVTYILLRNELLYFSDEIKYDCLSNICFDNETIYIPAEREITGFNYRKNRYKKFRVPIVSADSKLKKDNGKITVINDTEIFQLD